jgi:hypothetical protein
VRGFLRDGLFLDGHYRLSMRVARTTSSICRKRAASSWR